ncbi:uncharacterized protein LOC143010145 isoform X2 [Genypterus blacodes]|uniref:uncharacterized protein LOC143010145 isoform X2 n=1 Tax=Genypterus blacodes TaxID=154954 RepID=UPI003F765C26
MEEEGPVNFKALRAKFQEEAMLAQAKASRPAVAEKPKHFPPPPPPPPVVSGVNVAAENKTPGPGVITRDGLRASGGRRPHSFPPQPRQISPSSHLGNGGSAARQALKDLHLPLVLPGPPVKPRKTELPANKEHKPESEPPKEVLSQIKMKKKGLLLPFKSSKVSKVSAENRDEPTYADLTNRPSSAPGELSSLEGRNTEGATSPQSECSPSSPGVMLTPPSADTSGDSENRFVSTLERAKKKFSCRQFLISTKTKSLRSPDCASPDMPPPSSLKDSGTFECDIPVPPPVCLPHLACISARPFFKANTLSRKSALDKKVGKDKLEPHSVQTAEAFQPAGPLKQPLPDPGSVGQVPSKPPRPPRVDLSCYTLPTPPEVSPSSSQAALEEPEIEHPSISNPVLDAPEFPDFENLEVEPAEGETVDLGSLEVEALDLVSFDFPAPPDFEILELEDLQHDLSGYDFAPATSSQLYDATLSNYSIAPLDPDEFPDPPKLSEIPEPWSQRGDGFGAHLPHPPADEADLDPAEPGSLAEEADLGNQAAMNDGVQTDPSEQDSYYEACDNVYEDVDSINKVIKQNSRKRKGGLWNSNADNHPVKEEARLNMWPRNPWAIPGEHNHFPHNHAHSKDHQSPDGVDHKEQRKKEKQRLDRERKEQKEREKKGNEMRKKFKVTGEEEAMYHAKVMVANKVRKNDLPVKNGDTVSIIRTTNCPKGKWLARDANHKYGYISVMNVELNIKEMLELGKKAQAAGRGGNLEGDTISIGSRSSSHPVLTSSFTDDSEEWACEDETLSPSTESQSFLQPSVSVPDLCGHASAQHTLSDANLEDPNTLTRHEALQKLAIFFQQGKTEFSDVSESGGPTPTKYSIFFWQWLCLVLTCPIHAHNPVNCVNMSFPNIHLFLPKY